MTYSYQKAIDRGTWVQPRCLARVIPGKSWAGALVTDEDPEDRWRSSAKAQYQIRHRPKYREDE